MALAWPAGFRRVPDEPWVSSPVETPALKYDTVEGHGWYENLEPTGDDLTGFLRDGHVLVDYSGAALRRLARRSVGLRPSLPSAPTAPPRAESRS